MPFGFGRGRGRGGRGSGRGFRGGRGHGGFDSGGAPIKCICSNCGMMAPHHRGLPCFKTKCPRCGSAMTRQFLHEE